MNTVVSNSELQQAAIQQHLKALRMPTMAAQFSSMAEQAIRARQTHMGYLDALLAVELEKREEKFTSRVPEAWPAMRAGMTLATTRILGADLDSTECDSPVYITHLWCAAGAAVCATGADFEGV